MGEGRSTKHEDTVPAGDCACVGMPWSDLGDLVCVGVLQSGLALLQHDKSVVGCWSMVVSTTTARTWHYFEPQW
jgi:hypothetical protein